MSELTPFDLREQQDRENDRRHVNALDRQEAEKMWAWLMSGPQGRRVVRELLDWCGVYRSSFSTNGSEMSFREGQRNVGLKLLAAVQVAAPDFYLKMLEEQQ